MPKLTLTGEATEKVVGEWAWLRDKLSRKIKGDERASTNEKLAEWIGKSRVEGTESPSPHIIRRFRNGETQKPSNLLIEYLYQFLFQSDRSTYWNKSATPILQCLENTPKELPKDNAQALAKKLQDWKKQYSWYANDKDEEEKVIEDIKAELANNQEFIQIINVLANALKEGITTEGKPETILSLVNMKSLKKDAVDNYTYCGYTFHTGVTAWVEVNASNANASTDDDSLPQRLFGKYAQAIVDRRNYLRANDSESPVFPKDACLSKFLGLNKDCLYKPIILLVGFKADNSDGGNNGSTELITCYPSYDNQFDELVSNYTILNRVWWQDTDRLIWANSKDKPKFSLSRAYTSVRRNCKSERGLSLEIDLPDTPQYKNAKLVLSIQLALRKS